jgi:WXG100 family type VII secretion target
MALSLRPEEAQPKINQIDEEMADVRLLASRILDSTQSMTASSWKGGRAATFNQIMTQHHEDMNNVINNLQRIVDKTKGDINTFMAHEAN